MTLWTHSLIEVNNNGIQYDSITREDQKSLLGNGNFLEKVKFYLRF